MNADVTGQVQATETEAATAVGPVASVAPGKVLADARAERQMSVADVAQQLKLSVAQVEALETGEYGRLPGPVFVKGFVRNYARLVGVDATALLAALELPPSPSAAAAVPPSQDVPFESVRGFNWRPYLIVVLLLIGALGAYELWRSGVLRTSASAVTAPAPALPERQSASAAASASAPSAMMPPVPVQPVSSVVASEPLVPAARTDTEKEAAKVGVAVATGAERSAPPAPVPDARVPVPPAIDSGQVVLRFSALSWVEVRDRDDRVLLSQLNAPGSEKSLSGPKPLRLVIGNANAVRMSVAGKPFDLMPHTSLDVAKVILE